jgi:hypothetical protein
VVVVPVMPALSFVFCMDVSPVMFALPPMLSLPAISPVLLFMPVRPVPRRVPRRPRRPVLVFVVVFSFCADVSAVVLLLVFCARAQRSAPTSTKATTSAHSRMSVLVLLCFTVILLL